MCLRRRQRRCIIKCVSTKRERKKRGVFGEVERKSLKEDHPLCVSLKPYSCIWETLNIMDFKKIWKSFDPFFLHLSPARIVDVFLDLGPYLRRFFPALSVCFRLDRVRALKLFFVMQTLQVVLSNVFAFRRVLCRRHALFSLSSFDENTSMQFLQKNLKRRRATHGE